MTIRLFRWFYTAHAGDSRIYLIRGKGIKQITKDHSSVQKLIDMGVLTEEEAELSEKRNEIIKAIGIFEKVNATITPTALILRKNDKILLCSDGLTGHVNKEKIKDTVQSINNTQNAALKLIDMANDDGGRDNITVQLIHYTGNAIGSERKSWVKKIFALFIILVAAGCLSFWLYQNSRPNEKVNISVSNKSTSLKK
jgi:serine/threonine protein phosphatase PrpC